jgi:hypothetical protein
MCNAYGSLNCPEKWEMGLGLIIDTPDDWILLKDSRDHSKSI